MSTQYFAKKDFTTLNPEKNTRIDRKTDLYEKRRERS